MKQTDSQPPISSKQTDAELQAPAGQRLLLHFDEPRISSDSGLLILASDTWSQHVIDRLCSAIEDKRRNPEHSLRELLGQRILGIAGGYFDANDASTLRNDPVMQAAVGRDSATKDVTLASQPTLCRLENGVTRRDLLRLFHAMIDLFMDSYAGERVPEMLVLDLDPTACLTYGQQEFAMFNTHVGGHCLMPFHLYEGQSGRLIATVLRPGKTPSAKEILGLLRRVVRRIRKRWPKVRLMLRADSHHAKPEVLDWLDARKIDYAIGYAPNAALEREFAATIREVRMGYEINCRAGQPEIEVRRLHSATHQAGSWSKPRRVVGRAVAGPHGIDVRFIVTSFAHASAKALYDGVYCGRGEAELFIKEHKLDMGGDRLSCVSAQANQLRLFLHGAAYMMVDGFRRLRLHGTALARASASQIRLKLFKVAARFRATKQAIHLHLGETLPAREILTLVAARLLHASKSSLSWS